MRATLAAVIVGAFLLSGCGSGGGTAGGGEAEGEPAGDQEAVLAYENGYQQCTGFSLKDLQQTYDAEAATKQSIAEAVARSNPGAENLKEPTMRGCIDAIDKKPFTPSGEHGPAETDAS